jgi:hydroxymethylpyrimidine pyrophosphatase-like HAD family hydrolase
MVGSRRETSVGVGDGGNDVALLAAVGLGVAMAGSPLAELGCADVVAPPVEHDGLAWVLDSLVADPTGQTLRLGANTVPELLQ